MKRVVGIVAPDLVSRLVTSGIDPGAPRGLGGAELPWCKISLNSTKRVASALASGNLVREAFANGDLSRITSANLARGWSASFHQEGQELASALALGDFPASSVGFTSPAAGYESVPLIAKSVGSFDLLLRSAEADHLRAIRRMGLVRAAGPASDDKVGLHRISEAVKKDRLAVLSSYPGAPVSLHPVRSLQNFQRLVDQFCVGPYDPSQLVDVVRSRGGRARTEQLVAHPDTIQNRRRLLKVALLTVPEARSLVPLIEGEIPGFTAPSQVYLRNRL
jgi:hypothetical protein